MIPLVTAGIVNPFGPTLTVIAVIDDGTSAPPALTYAFLNPFRSQLLVLGYVFEGQLEKGFADQVLQYLEPHRPFAGGAPSFCVPSPFIDSLIQQYLLSRFTNESPGIGRLLRGFRRHPLDPWNRVAGEVQSARKALVEGNLETAEENGVTEKDLSEYVTQIINHRHCEAEISAFAYAWNGAIEFQKNQGNMEQLPNILTTDAAYRMISHVLLANDFQVSDNAQA